MPILMDGHPCQVRCFRCRKRGHKAHECKSKKLRECPLCGDRKHKKAGCPYRKPVKVEVEVQEECYALGERPARLELDGYDFVVWHVVLEACASDTQ